MSFDDFSIITPCDFVNLDDAADIISRLLESNLKHILPISVDTETGTFSVTSDGAYVYMDNPNRIGVDLTFDYTGDRGVDEDEFIQANSAVFAEFVEQVRLAIAVMIDDISLISKLPDAYVYLQNDDIFVQVSHHQNHLRLDWEAPEVYPPEDLEGILSDLFYE